MKHIKLDPKLKLNHHLASMKFVAESVCVTCVLKEGQCRRFQNGKYEDCYKHCWWFSQAVRKIEKVLDKYDK